MSESAFMIHSDAVVALERLALKIDAVRLCLAYAERDQHASTDALVQYQRDLLSARQSLLRQMSYVE